jgi:hypothetical protein
MSSDLKDLEKRLAELEKKVNTPSEKKEKKTRKPSEYNKFVQDYISSERKKNSTKSHRELFAEAAKAWTSKKD